MRLAVPKKCNLFRAVYSGCSGFGASQYLHQICCMSILRFAKLRVLSSPLLGAGQYNDRSARMQVLLVRSTSRLVLFCAF